MKHNHLSIGTRLYLSVLSLFLVFAVSFIVFQQYREKQYKVETLNLKLQDFNNLIYEDIKRGGTTKPKPDISLLKKIIEGSMGHEGMVRVTIITRSGEVVYDNLRHDYEAMGNHAGRPEVAQALKNGRGSAVERNSRTLGRDYFYSATFYPHEGLVIRSALPYNVDLAKNLQTDQHFIWFALAVMLLLTIILYRFTSRLGRSITKLKVFADRLSKGANVKGVEELKDFSNDELGDTAERIVKLYLRLQQTRQEQDVLKRQLTQNIAHELKTPVASIQGYLETIIDNPHVDELRCKLFLDRCYAQSKRLAALLSDISTLNRLDDGADLMTFEQVDVAEIIHMVEKESRFALEQHHMKMHCDIPEKIIIRGNRNLLYSIFRNLTDNAIAYAGKGTNIEIKAKFVHHASMLEEQQTKVDFVSFSFSDDGVGVAPEHLPRLFERFYRVDKGRSRKMGGTGLGLAIVKNAVRVHGGTISVHNNLTGGLRFDFFLRV